MPDLFAARFTLALKALSMSRGRLAAELGVDKSLVGRWASGAVTPSAYNLERLTHLLAGKRPGLTLLDWDRDMPAFAELFGVTLAKSETEARPPGLAGVVQDLVRSSVESRLDAYEGFWRSTHASFFEAGRFCHQYGIIRRAAGGGLTFELGAIGVRYGGTMSPVEGQIFAVASDNVRQVPGFMIFNVVAAPKIALLDGLLLAASSSLRVPAAYSIILERIGDLSDDREADDRHVEELMNQPEVLASSDILPEVVRRHLLRNFGPDAAAAGGEMMLSAPLTPRLAEILALNQRQ
ncbi:MAG: XRE family transcriptional regulator [Brevundimonas sp.]|nr:MAG: XRE family transcriptional regulator [Brevundimonas sp.]